MLLHHIMIYNFYLNKSKTINLEKLIELNNLEKQSGRIRLEDKLRQQEYYGAIEKIFDPLTKNKH